MGRAFSKALLFGCLVAGLFLSGCGFEPVYTARSTDGADISDTLASVSVDPISGRLGRDVRNELIRRLNGRIKGIPVAYELSVQLATSEQGVTVEEDDAINRYNLRLTANYSLKDLKSDTEVFKGRAKIFGAYDVVASQFATLTARRNVEERAAREAARDIEAKLAVFFAGRVGG